MGADEIIQEWESKTSGIRTRVEREIAQIRADGGGSMTITGLWATGPYPGRWLVILNHLAPDMEWTGEVHGLQIVMVARKKR